MPHRKDYARRLLRELPPKDPAKVLRSKSYGDPTFLPLFFDWLDDLIYHDPRAALRWARIAPELALKSPEEEGEEGRRVYIEQLLTAWIVRGSALRSCGDFAASDEAYGRAREIALTETVSESLRADLERRLSTLRACQDEEDEALELADGAVGVLRKIADEAARAVAKAAAKLRKATAAEAAAEGDAATAAEAAKSKAADAAAFANAAAVAANLRLGQALMSRGYVLASKLRRHGEAIDAFGEAVALAGDAKSSPAAMRLHETACNNLAMAIKESAPHRDKSKALHYTQQARTLLKGQVRSRALYRVLWVEGLIWCELGCHGRGEQLLRIAVEGFQALELPWEIALVGLDLAALHHLCGEWEKLEKLAAETYKRFQLLTADTKAIAALSLWNDAVKARKEKDLLEKFEEARKIVFAGVLSGRASKKKRK